MVNPHQAAMPDKETSRNCPSLPHLQFDSRSPPLFHVRTSALESNSKERKTMSEIETITERLADVERRLSQIHHPCMTRVEDLQEVIIRLTNEHNKVLRLQIEDLKKQTSSTTPLQVIANSIEFGHSHE